MVSRKTLLRLILSAAVAAVPVTAAWADALPGPVEARVVDVIDGDSLRVKARIWLSQDVETIVRLAGIDAPEMRGRCDEEKQRAQAARAALEDAVETVGGVVMLTGIEQDKFGGRVLARVADASGRDLARVLTDAGLARPYEGGRRESWCE
ncbi:thermonuclease family protein [Caenispirillum salinarum]|uniref:thermonuclease family protein n=1 Tax=Caenispirillum salinarum TaxID=859058 RepID=UPI0005B9D36B|nr:thermonuclease family protein [Caenispirillum salinarum]